MEGREATEEDVQAALDELLAQGLVDAVASAGTDGRIEVRYRIATKGQRQGNALQ